MTMWYSKNTSLLATTVIYRVGIDSINKINLELESEKIIKKDQIE